MPSKSPPFKQDGDLKRLMTTTSLPWHLSSHKRLKTSNAIESKTPDKFHGTLSVWNNPRTSFEVEQVTFRSFVGIRSNNSIETEEDDENGTGYWYCVKE